MTMDCLEDVLGLVAQEASALVDLLSEQDDQVLEKIFTLMDPSALEKIGSLVNKKERASAIVEYFKTSDHVACRSFFESIYQYCEEIPFYLETTLVSIAGYAAGTNFTHTSDNDDASTSQNVKRPRIDHLQRYTEALKVMIRENHARVTQAVVREIHLNDTWVYVKQKNPPRGKDRTLPPQSYLDSFEGEESDRKVSVESLLKTPGRILMLLGQAGSGKTLLVHCLGHSWSENTFPSIHLLFLLEFRHLNLISQDLSLKELLFLFYPAREDDDEQSTTVFDFIRSNPQKVCFILDGYDEFRGKLTNPTELRDITDPNISVPMADLISGLCSRKILPECTMLVTCRPRDVSDMFGSPGFIACELQGFDQSAVREYAEQFFRKKGEEFQKKAINLLMENRHFLSMSHVPGLCHICCVCVDYLFSSDGILEHQLPRSLTELYMQILMAYLKRFSGRGTCNENLLKMNRTKVIEINQLALNGLEKSTLVFTENEVSPELQEFGVRSGILSCVMLKHQDGSSGCGFTFMHLTMQEFLAALHLMTSQNFTERQLKKKLNLKSRWTTKIDPKTVFTDSLTLYVCGLAADTCTSSLILLKGSEGASAWVQKRQGAVHDVLRGLAVSASQTGPKMVEWCRCVYETQDAELAKAICSRPQFELRNIRLNIIDMDSLAFVTTAADQAICLDFGGCSIDLECLETLPSFKNVDHLIFRSRKYDDKFAEALSAFLSKLKSLQQLDFISSALTDVGAAKLSRALKDCPKITHLNVSDNSLKDEGMRKIVETLSRLPNILSILMGKNSISTEGIITLVESVAACTSLKELHVEYVNSFAFSRAIKRSAFPSHKRLTPWGEC
ncbi:hypothetical protein DNTS_034053 [Danionella cerebrum]|uniref:NACHT domain-containing protein n=1 Tax=Danionella cerebrum TaxID=2873325 RepID=A0A553NMF3_9TELE|nr:hypothetical protein DNTS_034053 [Danionella translucida]